MASLGSSIRSAARATYSAYSRLPIRWRLAGGSAALTLVILCGFAAIVGVLTTNAIQADFSRRVSQPADELARDVKLRLDYRGDGSSYVHKIRGPNLDDYAATERGRAHHHAGRQLRHRQRARPELRAARLVLGEHQRLAGRVAPGRGRQLPRPRDHPVRAAALGGPGDRQPREGLPHLRRARRRRCWRCSPASRPRAGRWSRSPSSPRPRARSGARAIPPCGSGSRRPRTRSPSSRARWSRCSRRSATPGRRPRPRCHASASSSRTPRTSCARR